MDKIVADIIRRLLLIGAGMESICSIVEMQNCRAISFLIHLLNASAVFCQVQSRAALGRLGDGRCSCTLDGFWQKTTFAGGVNRQAFLKCKFIRWSFVGCL